MVNDNTNMVYTELLAYMQEEYSSLTGGQTLNGSPASFPYMYFFLVGAPTRNVTLSNTEESIDTTYQIEFYAKTQNDARKMANTARSYMISEGFRCTTFQPLDSNSNVHRYVTRFTRLDV